MEENELIVFEENLTAEGLERIREESTTWPAKAVTKEEYSLVYDQHQRFKRLSIACRKKADELKREEKAKSKRTIDKIDNDLGIVMSVIDPLIAKLGDSRQRWDDEEEAYKMNTAFDQAKREREEFERQERIRKEQEETRKYFEDWDSALSENRLFGQAREQAVKDAELNAERERLDRERYEFECEKSRMDFDDAWEDAYPTQKEICKKIVEPTETAKEKLDDFGIVSSVINDPDDHVESIKIEDNHDVNICNFIIYSFGNEIKKMEDYYIHRIQNEDLGNAATVLILKIYENLDDFSNAVND